VVARQLPHHSAADHRYPRTLPRGYDRTLPKLIDGPFAGFPRVYHLAVELLSQSDAVVDLEFVEIIYRRLPVFHAFDDGRTLGSANHAPPGISREH